MLTLVLGSTGFAVVIAIESGHKFNTGYDVNKVLIPLSELWCECGGEAFRKLIVHTDKAQPDEARISQQFPAQNGMRMATHRPDSLDLDHSDFCLSVCVKALLRGESFGTGSALSSAIWVILASLEKSIVSRFFLKWNNPCFGNHMFVDKIVMRIFGLQNSEESNRKEFLNQSGSHKQVNDQEKAICIVINPTLILRNCLGVEKSMISFRKTSRLF
jgi:hypothetical protein